MELAQVAVSRRDPEARRFLQDLSWRGKRSRLGREPKAGKPYGVVTGFALLALSLTSLSSTAGERVAGSGNTGAIESRMAEWLAHPADFGVPPRTVRFKHTYKADLVGYGRMDIHLVGYTMPDGTTGRGFVNGGLTWSFFGPEIDSIKDEDLFVAYCGWAWLFPALQAGKVKTTFTSSGEEASYLAHKKKEGFTDLHVIERYKIGTSEITGFKAKRNGTPMQGAGDTEGEVVFPASDPRFHLPSIYFLIGQQVILDVR